MASEFWENPVAVSKVVVGVLVSLVSLLIGGATIWAILMIREVGQTSVERSSGPAMVDPLRSEPTLSVAPPLAVTLPGEAEFKGPAAEAAGPPPSSRSNRPSAFDASVGTRLDPLVLKGWDLSAPKTVPDFNAPKLKPRQDGR